MPRSPKGRAVARGLDARLHLQHAFMPAGYASLKTAQVNQKCRLTVNHGIYREFRNGGLVINYQSRRAMPCMIHRPQTTTVLTGGR